MHVPIANIMTVSHRRNVVENIVHLITKFSKGILRYFFHVVVESYINRH